MSMRSADARPFPHGGGVADDREHRAMTSDADTPANFLLIFAAPFAEEKSSRRRKEALQEIYPLSSAVDVLHAG